MAMRTRRWVTGSQQESQQPLFCPNLLGDLQIVTPATGTIISLAEARLYLRIDDDAHEEDDLILDLIETAIDYCEKSILGHRQFRTAVYDLPVRYWWGGELRLPRHPLQSVGSIKYYDFAGTLQTLSSSIYTVRAPWKAPGGISQASGQSYPDIGLNSEFPIVIRFTAGYLPGQCPPTVKQAIRMLLTQWYWQRCPTGKTDKETANAVRALLDAEGCRYT